MEQGKSGIKLLNDLLKSDEEYKHLNINPYNYKLSVSQVRRIDKLIWLLEPCLRSGKDSLVYSARSFIFRFMLNTRKLNASQIFMSFRCVQNQICRAMQKKKVTCKNKIMEVPKEIIEFYRNLQ